MKRAITIAFILASCLSFADIVPHDGRTATEKWAYMAATNAVDVGVAYWAKSGQPRPGGGGGGNIDTNGVKAVIDAEVGGTNTLVHAGVTNAVRRVLDRATYAHAFDNTLTPGRFGSQWQWTGYGWDVSGQGMAANITWEGDIWWYTGDDYGTVIAQEIGLTNETITLVFGGVTNVFRRGRTVQPDGKRLTATSVAATSGKIVKADANGDLVEALAADLSAHTHARSQITNFYHTHTKDQITDMTLDRITSGDYELRADLAVFVPDASTTNAWHPAYYYPRQGSEENPQQGDTRFGPPNFNQDYFGCWILPDWYFRDGQWQYRDSDPWTLPSYTDPTATRLKYPDGTQARYGRDQIETRLATTNYVGEAVGDATNLLWQAVGGVETLLDNALGGNE